MPGEPAPWAQLAPGVRRGISLARVRGAVDSGHRVPAPARRVLPAEVFDSAAPSAVLVALFEEQGEARVVLTRRAAHLRTHKGEVSFPGGRLDGTETPELGALREAAEEVALGPDLVDTVGRLSPLSTFSSRTTITPVVGLLRLRPVLVANPHEVEHVFDVPLSELAADGPFHEELWELEHGSFIPVWFFELPDDTIWGATARMLVELLRMVLGV
ncbi:MAG: NUDIX hydrolase [Acidimicrobiales bacterium]